MKSTGTGEKNSNNYREENPMTASSKTGEASGILSKRG